MPGTLSKQKSPILKLKFKPKIDSKSLGLFLQINPNLLMRKWPPRARAPNKRRHKHCLNFLIQVLMMTLHLLFFQRSQMKTCVMKCYTHPWSDTFRPSSKTMFEAFQKQYLGFCINRQVAVLTLNHIFERDFRYRGKLSRDLKLIK